MDWARTTARQDENHLSLWLGALIIQILRYVSSLASKVRKTIENNWKWNSLLLYRNIIHYTFSLNAMHNADLLSTLVQVMVWCHQATSHNLSSVHKDVCRHLATLRGNELNDWNDKSLSLSFRCKAWLCTLPWISIETPIFKPESMCLQKWYLQFIAETSRKVEHWK